MGFLFETIEKGRIGGDKMPEDVVRVNKNTIAISENVAEKFRQTRYQTESGEGEHMKLKLEYDQHQQAFRVTEGVNGFSFHIREGGGIRDWSSASQTVALGCATR